MLGVEGYGDFSGTVEMWNHDSGRWKEVTGNGKLAAIDTLYAFKVAPEEGVRAVVDFRRADDPPVGPEGTPPGHRDSEPGRTQLQTGWNFVPAPRYGSQDEVFGATAVEAVDDDLHSPGSQLGEAEKNAFSGYRVRVSEDVALTTDLDADDPTMTELYESLGLDPVIHERAGPTRPRVTTRPSWTPTTGSESAGRRGHE